MNVGVCLTHVTYLSFYQYCERVLSPKENVTVTALVQLERREGWPCFCLHPDPASRRGICLPSTDGHQELLQVRVNRFLSGQLDCSIKMRPDFRYLARTKLDVRREQPWRRQLVLAPERVRRGAEGRPRGKEDRLGADAHEGDLHAEDGEVEMQQ